MHNNPPPPPHTHTHTCTCTQTQLTHCVTLAHQLILNSLNAFHHQTFDVIEGWKGVALADYDAATKEEISFKEDDVIEIEHQCENG
jgi:hypothetical protein